LTQDARGCLAGFDLVATLGSLGKSETEASEAIRESNGAGLAPAPLIMTITLTGLLILLIVAGVCGAIGRAIGGGTRGGFLVSIAVGFIGALFGGMLARYFRLPELLVISVENQAFPILWSIIGAALFVALIHLISHGPVRRYY
jgi:uncharacterized membrane protein YeaQ/YmgE (transglycosylase-associated protein family)